jgi:hypothetical protein
MNIFTRTLTLFLSLSLLFVCALDQKTQAGQVAKSGANELVGKWEGGVTVGDRSMRMTLVLRNEGNKLSGQISNAHGDWAVTDVKFANGKWTIAWRTPEGGTGKMIGILKDNKLSGDWDNSPAFVGTFELTKAANAAK